MCKVGAWSIGDLTRCQLASTWGIRGPHHRTAMTMQLAIAGCSLVQGDVIAPRPCTFEPATIGSAHSFRR